uniref:UDP N-acetylglucosamine O-acyltransferase C-terminal domain-containing protein n=1 Tax=Oryza nivara TaxID=4536 RepID=A0A0E0FSG0_ORYNI
MAAAATRAVRRLLIASRSLHAISSEGAAREAATSFVHPAAVVHPDAVVGQNIRVISKLKNDGKKNNSPPIEILVKLSGSGAILGSDIPGQTIIGENNVIGHHAVVGVKCQDLKYKVIGDNNLIMGSCHIAHDCRIGNNNIFANNTLFAGHVVVEDCTHTAGAVVVHQFCHIGSFSFLGGGSVFNLNQIAQDVPRYMMVAGDRAELRGLNLEGLKRNGFSDQEVRMLRKAYQQVFMPSINSQSSFDERLAELEASLILWTGHVSHRVLERSRPFFDC